MGESLQWGRGHLWDPPIKAYEFMNSTSSVNMLEEQHCMLGRARGLNVSDRRRASSEAAQGHSDPRWPQRVNAPCFHS